MWPGVLRNDISVYQGENLAIGGATTSNQPSAKFGDSSYLGQVNSFVTSGTTVPAKSAAGIWIGTNNIWIGSGQNQAPSSVALHARTDVQTGIGELVGAGVHSFLLLGVYDLSLTNAFELAGTNTIAVRSAAASASQQYNAQLAALTVPGANILYFDIAAFINHLQSNPQAYGLQQILPLQPGVACNATCQQTSIFADTIHLTSAAQTLVGNYVASGDPIYNGTFTAYGAIADNIASSSAAATIRTQLSQATASGFASSLFDRLDASRGVPSPHDGEDHGGPAATPWSVFAFENVLGGNFVHVNSDASFQSELDATVTGLTAGAEYQASRQLRFGMAFNYGHAESDLTQTFGTTTTIDSFQAALYGSLSYPDWFLDGIATLGADDFSQTRLGSFGSFDSSPNGAIFTASARGGYLMKVGPVRVGPIAGLSYSQIWTDAFQEAGNPLYAVGFASQASGNLQASAGVEIRMANAAGWPFNPFMTATYDHACLWRGQPTSSYLADLPTQQLPTSDVCPGTSTLKQALSADTIKLALGTAVKLADGWEGTVTAYGLVGEQDGYALGVNGGLSHRF